MAVRVGSGSGAPADTNEAGNAEPAATIVIGNPAVADAAVHDGTTLILTGKSFGSTNLIILNADGDEVANALLTVTAPSGDMVTVQKGANRFSYRCEPTCEAMPLPGDAQGGFFEVVTAQTQARTGASQAAATAGPTN